MLASQEDRNQRDQAEIHGHTLPLKPSHNPGADALLNSHFVDETKA